MKAVRPYLERLNTMIDFISPFTSTEPAVGTALGLVKGVASVAIGICGRFEDMTKDIAGFLEIIPAIDRCAEVARDGGPLAEIYNALVNIYKDLLRFYLKMVVLFEESRFFLDTALEVLRPAVADITSSFNTHMALLSKLVEAENFASIQEIKDELVDTLIRDNLERNAEYEWSYHAKLEERTDEACRWLPATDAFAYWLLNARDSNIFALFGDMGTGKTMTTAFVADTLTQPGRTLCVYYCKDEHEAAQLGTIYRSILRQFLNQKPELKRFFAKWYKDTSLVSRVNPTQSPEKLRGLLHDIISSSKSPVFLVLDALDECEAHCRKQLLSLFQDLFDSNARLKVFVSSRYDAAIEAALPSGLTRVEMRSSRDRDRAIAAYHVGERYPHSPFYSKIVDVLAERADGSAIWLRLAAEYIAECRIDNDEGLENALAQLPSSKRLAELYGRLFAKRCKGIKQNKTLLRLALELLAVARRPLTREELLFAIFVVNPIGKDKATLAELDRLAHSVDVVDIGRPFLSVVDIGRPFISVADGKGGKSPRLRLVHQSLRELILAAPPLQWDSAEDNEDEERAGELEANLLQRCVKYLLFNECEESSLLPAPAQEFSETGLSAFGGMFDDEADEQADAEGPTPSGFDPSERGFGPFFAYAASYWTSHYAAAPAGRRPSARQLAALCRKGSRRLENWVEQWQRPSCSSAPEREFPEDMSSLDPLTVAAIFGPAGSAADLLELDLDSSVLARDSAWTAARRLIKRADVRTLHDLARHKDLRPILCCCRLLFMAIDVFQWPDAPDDDALASDWAALFDFVIDQAREGLLTQANDMLRRAARRGCLVLIKRLCSAAAADPDLRDALLAPGPDYARALSLQVHQSIGEAAYGGRAAVVRFLCEQPMFEPHLRHVNKHGFTVFHQAVWKPDEDILRTLVRHWPEGVDVRDVDDDTPLGYLLFNMGGTMEATLLRSLEVLLREGKADATGRHDPPGSSPLCTAVRAGVGEKGLRFLVVEGGADVWEAVGVDEATGRPFLLKEVARYPDEQVREKALKVLCSLLPFAASVDYLT
ncbi:uncharacterized protein THITE_2149928 [Thermothielavioides terrestris NRRL 8126]|uniref:Nephrocystin 3-like N-terminal domain-containing protein n=1 Tax=Thermothielavioides terrestris (strain ATCC 38088 / NRRL 8126) TaxID=578455 RepID=G2QZJ0_THETT|nr:uncharacterized protein THITE_2149928 [Thermothielavioides terrestris NRRL 8126]AEO65516.1 hypothetical protein THITE_2149928 [Thermothielavioides terrestris NRRL 8126]